MEGKRRGLKLEAARPNASRPANKQPSSFANSNCLRLGLASRWFDRLSSLASTPLPELRRILPPGNSGIGFEARRPSSCRARPHPLTLLLAPGWHQRRGEASHRGPEKGTAHHPAPVSHLRPGRSGGAWRACERAAAAAAGTGQRHARLNAGPAVPRAPRNRGATHPGLALSVGVNQ